MAFSKNSSVFFAVTLLFSIATANSVRGAEDPCAGANDSDIDQQQRREYCAAAKDAKEGAKKDKILGGVWAAVTATCTAICVTPLAGQTYGAAVCDAANMGASITDAMVTKQYASALSSVGMVGMSMMMRGGITTPKGSESRGRMSACLGAATAGIQTFIKFAAAKNHNSNADANLGNARRLNSINMPGTSTDPLAAKDSNTTAPVGSGIQGNADASSACSVATTSSNISAHISCAVSNDQNLPPFVRSPAFPAEFKKMTGTDLAEFLSKSQDNPSNAIASASGLDADGASKVASLMDDMNSKYGAAGLNSGIYAEGGGGGGGAAAGGGATPDFNEIMAG
ncbi:MAG TPA: hypothetical protein DCS07_12755, partial [Bdellovibrionales bacterium]|nr:hypothetical protein [Bdellovibrionales bacterium]